MEWNAISSFVLDRYYIYVLEWVTVDVIQTILYIRSSCAWDGLVDIYFFNAVVSLSLHLFLMT